MDRLKAFVFNVSSFDIEPISQSEEGLPEDENRMPGGVLALSWDGRSDDTAIVWATLPTNADANNKSVPGKLLAFDALDLKKEPIWTSELDPAGDDRLGNLAKFSPPVVANGKVYVGTFSRELVVYGSFDESGRPGRSDDAGIFELRNVGEAEKVGSYVCGKYELRITGRGIGVIPVRDDQTKAIKPGKWEDEFLFANVQRNMGVGQVAVTALVEGMNAPDDSNPLAGVIIRRDSGPGDVFAAIFINNQKEILFMHRDNLQGTVVTVKHDWQGQNATIQVFIRIVAQNVDLKPGFVGFTGEFSKNGSNWNRIGDVTEIKMDDVANIDVKVGLAVSAQTYPKDPAFLAHTTFSHVDVQGG